MSEWWTYNLSDFVLFAPQTYLRLMERYNQAVWPLQVAALILGAAIAVIVFYTPARQERVITAVVSAAWIWIAWAFHLQHYATIHWAAPLFAALFAGEAALLIWTGVIRGRLVYRVESGLIPAVGFGVFLFALVGQPVIAALLRQRWAQAEIFGTAPDPTVIGTMGLLLLAANRAFWQLLIIPAIWCAISGATLWALGSPLALAAPLAALIVLVLASQKTRVKPRQAKYSNAAFSR